MVPLPPTYLPRILEINLISAKGLAAVSRNMKTYVVVWVQPDKKHTTGVDQTGGTKPIWNDKVRFQVDDKFLNSDDASIFVEIYAAAWVKDVLIGCVKVLIKDIFLLQSVADNNINNSDTRTVTLQIRRPSGRPQGILNMKVSLVGCNEVSKQKTTQDYENDNRDKPENHNPNPEITREDGFEKTPEMEPIVNGGSDDSEIIDNGSAVNGESLCNSDVGPSASIVAAAIAKGLYNPSVDQHQAQTQEARKLREWTRKARGEIQERWPSGSRQEHTVGVCQRGKPKGCSVDGRKLFSCFGNAFGIEVSITCGGNRKKNNNGKNKIFHLSSIAS